MSGRGSITPIAVNLGRAGGVQFIGQWMPENWPLVKQRASLPPEFGNGLFSEEETQLACSLAWG